MSRTPEMWIHMREHVQDGVTLPHVIIDEREADRLARLGEEVWRVMGLERLRYEKVPTPAGSQGTDQ